MRSLTIAEARRRVVRVLVTRSAVYGGYAGAVIVTIVVALMDMGFEDGPHAGWLGVHEILVNVPVLAFATTALLSAIVVQRATRPADASGREVTPRAIVGAIANAPLFAGLGLACGLFALGPAFETGGLTDRLARTVLALVGITLVGLSVTVPLGLVFGGVFANVIHAAQPMLDAPTVCAAPRARLLSLRVAVAALVPVAALVLMDAQPSTCLVLAAPLIAVAAVDAGLAWLELARAQRWLADVRADRAAGLRVVPVAECHVGADLAPMVALEHRDALAVIDDRASAYRDRPVAIALVPRSSPGRRNAPALSGGASRG